MPIKKSSDKRVSQSTVTRERLHLCNASLYTILFYRLTKERDFYTTQFETLQNLIISERKEAANDKAIFSRIAADANSARKE